MDAFLVSIRTNGDDIVVEGIIFWVAEWSVWLIISTNVMKASNLMTTPGMDAEVLNSDQPPTSTPNNDISPPINLLVPSWALRLSVTRTMGNRTLPTKSPEWRSLRSQILIRDERTCASCGFKSSHPLGRGMIVDHKDGDATNNDPANFRVHCPPCEAIRHCGLHGMEGHLWIVKSDLEQVDIVRKTRAMFEANGKMPRVREVDPLASPVDISMVDFANLLLKTDWEDLPDERKCLRGFFSKRAGDLFSITAAPSDPSELRAMQILELETSLPWICFSPESHGTLQKFLETWRPSSVKQSDVAWISVSNSKFQATDNAPSSDIAALRRAWINSCSNDQASISELDRLAREFAVLGGKWLIFASVDKIDALWSRIARSTHAGTLGSSAKVAPYVESSDPSDRQVICVFTRDYTDRGEVSRVRESLRRLGLKEKIGYKPNIYTYCDIYAKNRWNILPTRYHM